MCFYLGGYSLGGHYYYHLNRRWAVGLLAGMSVERQDFFTLPKDAPGDILFSDTRFYSLAPRCT